MGSGMALGDYNCSTGLNESLHGNKLVIVSLEMTSQHSSPVEEEGGDEIGGEG